MTGFEDYPDPMDSLPDQPPSKPGKSGKGFKPPKLPSWWPIAAVTGFVGLLLVVNSLTPVEGPPTALPPEAPPESPAVIKAKAEIAAQTQATMEMRLACGESLTQVITALEGQIERARASRWSRSRPSHEELSQALQGQMKTTARITRDGKVSTKALESSELREALFTLKDISSALTQPHRGDIPVITTLMLGKAMEECDQTLKELSSLTQAQSAIQSITEEAPSEAIDPAK